MIVHWVERTCHRKRRQRRLGKLTPVEYELVHHKAVALAASTPESTKPPAVPDELGEYSGPKKEKDTQVSGPTCVNATRLLAKERV